MFNLEINISFSYLLEFKILKFRLNANAYNERVDSVFPTRPDIPRFVY